MALATKAMCPAFGLARVVYEAESKRRSENNAMTGRHRRIDHDRYHRRMVESNRSAQPPHSPDSDTGIDLRAVTHFVRTLRVDDVDCWPTRIDGMEMTFRRSKPTPLGSAM